MGSPVCPTKKGLSERPPEVLNRALPGGMFDQLFPSKATAPATADASPIAPFNNIATSQVLTSKVTTNTSNDSSPTLAPTFPNDNDTEFNPPSDLGVIDSPIQPSNHDSDNEEEYSRPKNHVLDIYEDELFPLVDLPAFSVVVRDECVRIRHVSFSQFVYYYLVFLPYFLLPRSIHILLPLNRSLKMLYQQICF